MNAPLHPLATQYVVADLNDPGECARIEGFVRECGGSLFQCPQWLRAVEAGTGQKATGIIAERLGAIIGWLPLSSIASPLFGRALVSSGFGVGGGVLSDDGQVACELCRMAEELASRTSHSTIELRGGAIPPDWRTWSDRHANFSADLAGDDEAQLLWVQRKQRADIRKSLDADLAVTTGRDRADRAAHYALYAQSVHSLGTPVFPSSLFDAMLDAFPDNSDILTVHSPDSPVASVLSFYHQGTVMPFWGGGSFAARALKANERMYFELMLHARRRGMSRFDFGRSKTGSGPFNYKKNWGFEPQPLTYGMWNAPDREPRDLDPTDASYSAKIALWKKLPLPLANLIGPHIARGLG